MIIKVRLKSGWKGLYFGGVAFKYQRPVRHVQDAALIAMNYMDVVTTSGPGTGLPAHLDKIKAMKQALGDFPLGIASGIILDNVKDYLPYADFFLVATGISINFNELDIKKVEKLAQIIHSM